MGKIHLGFQMGNTERNVLGVLLCNKRIRKTSAEFGDADKDHYFETMQASFRHFVRPRLVKAMKLYR